MLIPCVGPEQLSIPANDLTPGYQKRGWAKGEFRVDTRVFCRKPYATAWQNRPMSGRGSNQAYGTSRRLCFWPPFSILVSSVVFRLSIDPHHLFGSHISHTRPRSSSSSPACQLTRPANAPKTAGLARFFCKGRARCAVVLLSAPCLGGFKGKVKRNTAMCLCPGPAIWTRHSHGLWKAGGTRDPGPPGGMYFQFCEEDQALRVPYLPGKALEACRGRKLFFLGGV